MMKRAYDLVPLKDCLITVDGYNTPDLVIDVEDVGGGVVEVTTQSTLDGHGEPIPLFSALLVEYTVKEKEGTV